MRNITNGASISGFCVAGSPSFGLSTITLPLETPLRTMAAAASINGTIGSLSYATANNNYTSGDLASVDSSDTYASCQTHPFLSQADLDLADFDMDDDNACTLDDLDMNNLYINPLEKDSVGPRRRSQVKKSASGDTALRSLADNSPMDENGTSGGGGGSGGGAVYHHYPTFEQRERGSRGSLNETTTPVPKHRKTRYQQSSATAAAVAAAAAAAIASKPKARFDVGTCGKQSLESLGSGTFAASVATPPGNEAKKKSGTNRSSFMPAKSLASATKLINQHLFGIQSIGSRGMFGCVQI